MRGKFLWAAFVAWAILYGTACGLLQFYLMGY